MRTKKNTSCAADKLRQERRLNEMPDGISFKLHARHLACMCNHIGETASADFSSCAADKLRQERKR